MLSKVKSALLLTPVDSFAEHYTALAEGIGVRMERRDEWGRMFRMGADVVIYGSRYFDCMNSAYYPSSVIILREGESPEPYIEAGVSRFIFNHRNSYELLCALYKEEAVIVHASGGGLEEILRNAPAVRFCFGKYDFRFDENLFAYGGHSIYMPESSKRYLAEWLLRGNKDNSKRMILCNLRKKFGKDFLRDIDRFGQIKEKKDGKRK